MLLAKSHAALPILLEPMLTELPGVALLVAAIAIAPALVCWWQGRRLMRLSGDAALPERLIAARGRNGAMVGAAFVLLAGASTDALPWTLPLMIVTLVIASYPLRKALFGETWSLPTYVWFVTRLLVAIWGFWFALSLVPMLAGAAGSLDWLAATAVAALLMIWNARYADVLRFLLRARPIDEGEPHAAALLSRFRGMVQTSGIPMPRFERVDLRGGAVANALALPSLRGSSVLFSDTLLDRLEPEETIAICAHELAHLEHFNPQRLRRLNAVNLLLIVSGAAVAPLSRLAGLTSYVLPLMLWALAVVGAMAWRARDRQHNETASDLRAVALCGNAEALVSGLIRLYTMARMPRRLDSVTEQRATHPSLARRIRDIRAANGGLAATLPAPVSFTGTDGRWVVTFENDTLHWTDEAAIHSLSYTHLAELRLEVRGRRPAALIALERAGRRWELPLLADDVARAQAVLDIVDARLPAPEAPASLWPKVGRLVLAFGVLIGLCIGQLAMAFVALLAVVQPAAPLVAAAGIASLAAGGLLLRHAGLAGGASTELALVLAVFGGVLLYMAKSRRGEKIPRHAAIPAALLGAFATLSVLLLALSGLDPVRLHQSARSSTAAPVFLLAFAGALALWRSRMARYAAIPVIVVAAATTVAASTTFLDRFGRDPFLVLGERQPLAWRTVPADPVSEFSVPFAASALQLSPTGRHVAVESGADRRELDEPVTFHVGPAGGPLSPVTADQLIFAGDDILMVSADGDGVELRQVRAGAPDRAVWRVRVPDLVRETLSFRSASRRWRLMGWDRRRRQIVRAEGLLGEPGFQRTEWFARDRDEGWIHSLASSGSEALLVDNRHHTGFLQQQGLWRWAWMLVQPDSDTRFRAPGGGGLHDVAVSRLDARCHDAPLDSDALLCSAFDGTRTRFIAIDPVSKRIEAVASLDGQFVTLGSPAGEWLSGWRGGTPVALNLQRRQALRIDASCKDAIVQIAPSDHLVGTIAFDGAGSTVRLYKWN